MKKFLSMVVAGFLAAGLIVSPWLLHGAEPPKAAPSDNPSVDKSADKPAAEKLAAKSSPDEAAPAEPAVDLRDPAFDRCVDLGLLNKAWADLDAAALADAGLQLAEGERVLLRPHKGITADQVLSVAAKVAAEKRDAATLTRLTKAAEALGKKALGDQVAAAQKLASASRAVDPAATVSAEHTSVAAFADYKETLTKITAAKLANDGKTLELIAKEAGNIEGLTEDQRKNLAKSATEAREALSKDDAGKDPAIATLMKLSLASRGQDPMTMQWRTTYKYNGTPIIAQVQLFSDGSGVYNLNDGTQGTLSGVQFDGSAYSGQWSLGGDNGTFYWQVNGNLTSFNGNWNSLSGGGGSWTGVRSGGPLKPPHHP